MKKINLTLYSFDELPNESQQAIIERERWNIMEGCMDAYGLDYRESLKQFENIFDVNCRSWSVDYCSSFYQFQVDKIEAFEWCRGDNDKYDFIELSSIKGSLLLRYLQNHILPYIIKGKYFGKLIGTHPNMKHQKRYSKIMFESDCPMTGTCYDNYLLHPFLEFLKKPDMNVTYHVLMDRCLNSFFNEWHKEYEYWADDEDAIREELHNNQYEDQLYHKNGDVYNGPLEDAA